MTPLCRDSNTWVESWLSFPRWATYLSCVDGNAEAAQVLYEWNLSLAQSIMRDIAHIEVGIRNRYDQVISSGWPGSQHWLLDPQSPVWIKVVRTGKHGIRIDKNDKNRQNISNTISRIPSRTPSPDQIITELPFGFWRHLTDAFHEKTLWIPYLSKSFPKGTNRKTIESSMFLINIVRNRASHHEQFVTDRRQREVSAAYSTSVRLAQMIMPELGMYIEDTSTVTSVLKNRPVTM